MIMDLLIPYIQEQLELNSGVRLNNITRHILGLFHGETGARGWRRHLSENAGKPGAGINVLLDAVPKDESNGRELTA
jgi:tRNA-dihydrouridine synthase A